MKQLRFPVTRKEAEKAGRLYSSEANKNAMFPSRLRALREEKNVSQAGLAKAMGVSKSTIGLYETGDTLPDIQTADMLSDFFEVSTDYLICRTDVRSASADIRKMSEYTGLSEVNIEGLHDLELEPSVCGPIREILNQLLGMENFENLLLQINLLKKAVEADLNSKLPVPFTEEEKRVVQDFYAAQKILDSHYPGTYKIVTGANYLSLIRYGLSQGFDEVVRIVVYDTDNALKELRRLDDKKRKRSRTRANQ